MDINIDKNIFNKAGVKLAYLFGSRAKDAAAAESDFDIAVLFEKPPSDPYALRETMDLSSELRRHLPTKVDVVSLHSASLLLKYEVVAHSRLLYCKNEKERIDFEVLATKEYIDEEPVRKLYNDALHKRILQKGA